MARRVRVGIPGETFTGPPGEPGPPGQGLTILGTLASTSELPANASPGDGYIVGGELHVWTGEAWTNVGQIVGPPGEDGGDGVSLTATFEGDELVVRNAATNAEIARANVRGAAGATGQTGATGDSITAFFEGYELVITNARTQAELARANVRGLPGEDGADGLGVPPGGATGQVLTKNSPADNDTTWLDSPPPGPHADSHSTSGTDSISPEDIGAQPSGDYATNDALNTGLAGKSDTEHLHDGRYVQNSSKGAASGVAPLDEGARIPLNHLPDDVLNRLSDQGLWNAATNTPDLGSLTKRKGQYWVVSVAGSASYGGKTDWNPKDWIVWNGSSWDWVENTDSVTRVFNRTGNISPQAGDYTAEQISFQAAGGIIATNVQAALAELDSEKQAVSEKNQNNGYAGLNASGRVDPVRLGSGTRNGARLLRDDGAWVDAPAASAAASFCKVERRTDQSIPTAGGWNLITWDFEVSDTEGMWVSSNPTQIIVPAAGLYLIYATCTYAGPANTSGTRAIRMGRNSTAAVLASPFQPASADGFGRNQLDGLIQCAAGDSLFVEVRQDSGSTLQFGTGGSSALATPYFAAARIK